MNSCDRNHPLSGLLDEEISILAKKQNTPNSFLPFNTKKDPFCWEVVIGNLLSTMLNKRLTNYSYAQLQEDAKKFFLPIIRNEEAWDLVSKAYFEKKSLFNVSPEFCVLNCDNKKSGVDFRFSTFYSNLLCGKKMEFDKSQLNFFERRFAELVKNKLELGTGCEDSRVVYLPFMAQMFQKDLEWLSSNSKYFLKEIKNFCLFYLFTYTAQLGLSISEWATAEEPCVKPLYFILESERASMERTSISTYGYKYFRAGIENLFPLLSMTEGLQAKQDNALPLWALLQLFNSLENQQRVVDALNTYSETFYIDRGLTEPKYSLQCNVKDCLWYLAVLYEKQFTDKRAKSNRHGVHTKYAGYVESYLADAFIQARGRVGKVLVLSQDTILLLTNMVIGTQEKLRFYEVIKEFQARGVYLDKQSEQELIAFYDRIGNVERLSDSGDAVYVCRTV